MNGKMQIIKTSEIEHQLPETRLGDTYPYALTSSILQTKQLDITSELVRPGTKASGPHYHRTIDEIILVTKGELFAVEADQEVLLEVGDMILFEANSEKFHYLENRSREEAIFLILRRSIRISDVVYPK